jgi:pyrimidine deaminase RibD-like protein/RNA-binding protein YhbY
MSSDDSWSSGVGTDNAVVKVDEYMDVEFMKQAVECARLGQGWTFPNPAVGCVLVDTSARTNTVLGKGFHPKAGMPHAEVFGLLEAMGLVDSGVQAATSVMDDIADTTSSSTNIDPSLAKWIDLYKSKGASPLIKASKTRLKDLNVTAYVTLEPCCHDGQTPPCAALLVEAGVSRVVVGWRDPNPRVSGGGVQLLEEAGVSVDLLPKYSNIGKACGQLVQNFSRRITLVTPDYDETMSGAKRRLLRSWSHQKKTEGTLVEMEFSKWTGPPLVKREQVQEVTLKSQWLEQVDANLLQHEVVLLRLKGVASKKQAAQALGLMVADALGAHVAQVMGHTVLLYRPSSVRSPILDLDKMMLDKAAAGAARAESQAQQPY